MQLNGIEIDLINQIAKKYRKEIKYGNWYEHFGRLYLYKVQNAGPLISPSSIPVWTERDCLDFMKSKDYYYSIHDQVGGGTVIDMFILTDKNLVSPVGQRSMQEQIHGGTLLEACLLAVMIILQDEEIVISSGN